MFLKKNRAILIIFFVIFILRLVFLSPWLEDWDSVQFSLALHEFDILKHQPHPPGYPLYILLGKFLYYFFKSDVRALTFLSALFGSLSVFITYLFTKRMFNKKVALFSAIILSILPVHWVLSEIAISNIPGLFFLTLLVYISYRDLTGSNDEAPSTLRSGYLLPTLRRERNPSEAINSSLSSASSRSRYFAKGDKTLLGFISGLSLGIRATDAPIIIGVLLFSALKKRRIKYLIYLSIGLFLGISIWFIPLIFKTGFDAFRDANAEISRYIIWHDMLSGKPFSLFIYTKTRIFNFIKLMNIGYTFPLVLFFVISLIKIVLRKNVFKDTAFQILFVFFISYTIPLIFFYNQELAQYTLPVAPVVAIIVSLYITSFKKPWVTNTIFISLALYLFITSLSLVHYQSASIPPTIEPINYIKERLKAEETLLITTYTYRQFQYYLPGFKNYYGVSNAPQEITSNYVVTDYNGLIKQISSLAQNYQLIDQVQFGPSKNPFVRVNKTNIFILKRK